MSHKNTVSLYSQIVTTKIKWKAKAFKKGFCENSFKQFKMIQSFTIA